MKKMILMTLTLAAIAMTAHLSGISVRRAGSGNEVLSQTIQVGGVSIRTKAFSEQGRTVVAAPIGPIEVLYLAGRR